VLLTRTHQAAIDQAAQTVRSRTDWRWQQQDHQPTMAKTPPSTDFTTRIEKAMTTTLNPPLDLRTTAGAKLDIELEAMPGAGSIWSLHHEAPPDGCQLDEGDGEAIGAGFGGKARQHFTFVAATPGHYTLDFDLGCVWESTVRAKQPIHIDVG
jgi:hypothetical protein